MRRWFDAVVLTLAMLLSGCGLKVPDHIGLPAELVGEPQTLEAATAAAQERSDRYSSGDLAGAWMLSSRQLRDGISQTDYVTYIQTCKSPGLPVNVVGVRMNGNEQAIVREDVLGFKNSVTMVYEDGQWLRAPDAEFAASLGQPIAALIASEKAAGRCLKDSPPTSLGNSSPVPTISLPTSTVPTPNQAPLHLPSTSDARADRPGGTGHLVAVRLARNDGFDRVVLEFADRVPSYTVGYRPLPALADPSGKEIPLPGADASVQITLSDATGNGGGPDGERTYFGSSIVLADTQVVTEAKAAGDFENVLSWVVGLRSETPFSVLIFAGPPRLVIDFVH